MKLPFFYAICTLWFTATNCFGQALFEETLVIPVNRSTYGPRGMPGDIIELKDGALLMSYTLSGSIMAMKSSDKGKNWGESSVLVPAPEQPAKGRFCHPSFLRLPNGEILLSYIYSSGSRPYFVHNYVRRSADEGKTWTEQFCMTPYPGHTTAHNDRLFTLSTGRIVAMAQHKARWPNSRGHSGYVGLAFYSDDLGYSWQMSKNVVDMGKNVEVQEADGVELKDGRIMMFARNYSGHPVRAYSDDQGESWSEGEMIEELNMPYAGLPTVRRIPSTGDLLFIWISERSTDKDNPKVARRSALSSCISKDEGKSFIHQRPIAQNPEDDFGYQCIEFIGDDLAVIAYHCRDGLRVARINTNWFYGK